MFTNVPFLNFPLSKYKNPQSDVGGCGVVQADSGSGDAGPEGGGLPVRLHLQLLQQPVCRQGVCAAICMALHPLPGQAPR